MFKYVFGPVPSRRLGVSLGIDLVEAKTCNLNCIYCECGTNKYTYDNTRKAYVDIEVVKKEVKEALKTIKPNYITFSGSGEPTLNNRIGELIHWVKSELNIKVAVITNSTLLYQEEIRKEISEADVILPSLDAITRDVFLRLNRPHPSITAESIIDGVRELAKEYKGKMYLEIFITSGLNDTDEELSEFVKFLKDIDIDGIQLNTLARPGAVEWIKPATFERLDEIKGIFEKAGIRNVEVIKKYIKREQLKGYSRENEELILGMIGKRPYSLEELRGVIGEDLHKYLEIMETKGEVKTTYKDEEFYVEKQ